MRRASPGMFPGCLRCGDRVRTYLLAFFFFAAFFAFLAFFVFLTFFVFLAFFAFFAMSPSPFVWAYTPRNTGSIF